MLEVVSDLAQAQQEVGVLTREVPDVTFGQ
jgi:hypothetical protein